MRIAAILLVVFGPNAARADGPIVIPEPAPEILRESSIYRPTPADPAGYQPWRIDDSCGRPTLIDPSTSSPSCGWMIDGFLFGWSGPSRVEVTIEDHPRHRLALRRWARELWHRQHGGLHGFRDTFKSGRMRIWESSTGRAVEWVTGTVFGGYGEVDPIWGITRFQEQRGLLVHVDVRFYGNPTQDERDQMRRIFVDGPLGSPPP